MRNIHLTLQGKGGVGKTFIASLITQSLIFREQPVVAIDADPVNSTFVGYKKIGAKALPIMEGNSLVERNYDLMMERFFKEDSNFVVDNGASSFVPLSNYLISNKAINMIVEKGKDVVIHTVITGGQGILDTMHGFVALAEQMPSCAEIIVWINEFFGNAQYNNISFEKSKAYEKHKDRILGIVRLPKYPENTYGVDIEQMLREKLTFDEVAASDDFNIMSKSRLFRVKNAIFAQLELLF